MLLFPGLRSLRLQLDNPPERLYLDKEFSKLTALTSLELGQSFTAIHYKPTFSAVASSRVLQLLTDCMAANITILWVDNGMTVDKPACRR